MGAIINAAKRTVVFFKPLIERVLEGEASLARRWVSSVHRRLMVVQWGMGPQPSHFDHHIDLFYQWLETRDPLWLERGVFGGLSLKGGDVLELACGDGFNARNFYSLKSSRVVACDIDPRAIKMAQRKNSCPNTRFILADIRTDMPEGRFDNVVWDAAIEHFNQDEIKTILENIRARLKEDGVLSGYTIVEKDSGEKSHHQHEYEFKGKEDLLSILSPHFTHVTVFETVYPERHNLYFWASESVLPFAPEWHGAVSKREKE